LNAPQSFERVILKVLNGVQEGAEVSLLPGEYTIGTGENDDIQLIDVSVAVEHARIRIGAGTIEAAGGSGSVLLGSTATLPAGSAFQEIEPLDVIEIGMVRFVLGPSNANWNTLIDKHGDANQGKGDQVKRDSSLLGRLAARQTTAENVLRQLILPVVLSFVMLGAGIWFFSNHETSTSQGVTSAENQTTVRAALDQFPFGKSVKLRVEADGTLFAEGFVQDNFERRALVQAIEKNGGEVNLRIKVIDVLRNEIDGLIRAENLPITYELSSDGAATLKGVVLDAHVADSFVERLEVSVIGLKSVVSEIRTAETFLREIQELSRLAEIDSYVILRLDEELIEATGILPTDRIDGWEGFLQAYVRRFADDIGLRSFVQLQSSEGTLTAANVGKVRPVVISGKKRSEDDIVLNARELVQGNYQTSDFFARTDSLSSGEQAYPYKMDALESHLSTLNLRSKFDIEPVVEASNELINQWINRKRTSPQDDDLTKLAIGRMKLEQVRHDEIQSDSVAFDFNKDADRREAAIRYFPIFTTRLNADDSETCRAGSRLTRSNVPIALFWLDLLSISETVSLKTFRPEEQAFVLEAALDPSLAVNCLPAGNKQLRTYSIYLAEIERNPAIVRVVTRHMSSFPMDVTGASLAESRYVQMKDGQKLKEGGAPDAESRLSVIGEFGAVVQKKDEFSTVIYNPTLNWLSQN
jgi:type III secretion system YscD/HrpQ family protein